MSDEINHDCTDEPVCPHCGKEQRDAWEWDDDECGETECGSCGREFSYTRHISINWTTRKEIDCPVCRGRGRKIGQRAEENCATCQGKGSIPNDHPISDVTDEKEAQP